jgi:uncharacterized small protein (DUF1192 family)
VNCAQHIPKKLDAAIVDKTLAGLEARIAALSAENDRLRAELAAKISGADARALFS